MALIPWNSIAESVVDSEDSRLKFDEAITSPCNSCPTSPCCTTVPLHTFKITSMTEMDHAIYLLNFDHIELGLSATGDWSVYYRYPCRYLDREKYVCTVHNQPLQPNICRHYNPYSCWYKPVFTTSIGEEFIRIDRQRLEYIVSQVVFDEARNVVEVPDWDSLTREFAQLAPLPAPQPAEPLEHYPGPLNPQKHLVTLDAIQVKDTAVYTYDVLTDPCSTCQAYCCHTLVFPAGPPANMANLDYFQFCLGFPGLELGVSDAGWSLVVKTTCRHLQDNRCSLFGQPERPQICRYYDEYSCTYKINFGQERPEGYLSVQYEQFGWLTECFPFDQSGQVLEVPPVELIRQHFAKRSGLVAGDEEE